MTLLAQLNKSATFFFLHLASDFCVNYLNEVKGPVVL